MHIYICRGTKKTASKNKNLKKKQSIQLHLKAVYVYLFNSVLIKNSYHQQHHMDIKINKLNNQNKKLQRKNSDWVFFFLKNKKKPNRGLQCKVKKIQKKNKFKMYQRLSVEILVLVTLITSIVNVSVAAEDSWFGPEFGVLQKVYDDCSSKNDFTGCLKGKALGAISKAVDQVWKLSSLSLS